MTSFQIEPRMIPKDCKPHIYIRRQFDIRYKWLCVSFRYTGSGSTAREAYINWKRSNDQAL